MVSIKASGGDLRNENAKRKCDLRNTELGCREPIRGL